MLVVADTSPIIVLVNIQSIDLLPKLFEHVRIPPQVADELRWQTRPLAVQNFISNPPPWLIVQSPSKLLPLPTLDPGEQAAISLAEELHADLLLIDEIKGRRVAAARNLTLTGTIGVLELAAAKKLVDLKSAFDRIKQTDFWISHGLLDQRLAQFRATHGRS